MHIINLKTLRFNKLRVLVNYNSIGILCINIQLYRYILETSKKFSFYFIFLWIIQPTMLWILNIIQVFRHSMCRYIKLYTINCNYLFTDPSTFFEKQYPATRLRTTLLSRCLTNQMWEPIIAYQLTPLETLKAH